MDKEESVLELLDIYTEMVEKQDEIIYRMSHLLKEYATEVQHLRNILQCTVDSDGNAQDEAILEECMHDYKELKGLD